jgi:hypothetical protein
MLGRPELQLTGPYDSNYFSFGLPADWKLTAGANLNLSLMIALNSGVTANAGLANSVETLGGTLTVYFNDVTVAVLLLNQVGEVSFTVQIPPENLISNRTDGLMVVGFVLDSAKSCQTLEQLNVLVRTSSYFVLPHELSNPSTDLANFPRPLYNDSFLQDSALLVIPDKPSAADLQSALTLSAGLGNLTFGGLAVDLTTVSKLTEEQKLSNHIIYVGNIASFPNLDNLKLPQNPIQGNFPLQVEKPDEVGVVQMVSSPWSNSHAVMVVSGNTDMATIKAAQAVSSGVFRSNTTPNLALVQEVQTKPVLVTPVIDQTLTDLGYSGRLFEHRGIETSTYTFNLLPGWVPGPDSSFDLVFGHSALLNYDRSGISIILNDKPIGSVRLSDVTAAKSTNKATINLPANAVVPGKNRLDVRVNQIPHDDCTPPNMRGLWVNIWPESLLHLPVTRAATDSIIDMNLGIFPAPFTYYPELENTAFVLPHDNLETWRSAAQIANYFGVQANGSLTGLSAFYGDAMPMAERSKYNILVFGQPSQMPIIGEMNSLMPAPFADGSSTPQEKNFQVTYIVPSNSPMGYLEAFLSPWNPDRAVLAILGNTQQGLDWAATTLIEPIQRAKLSGNFAVIKDKQVITTDTRQTSTQGGDVTQDQGVAIVVPEAKPAAPVTQRPAWILPAIGILVAIIVLILISAGISSILRNRRKKI